ncbi:hypothetical protein [Brevibacillus sp. AY1]|uniref:hypothetical protein n=1 Tax=Brevibacillus sp. AY1 TaxID=2807621 RepID=UPI00245645B6|nr:hypothetical protein [Brevibacillus sp. AY1]MDH4620032.1 hypothetical protein [Brevibacillus sp. AY1]
MSGDYLKTTIVKEMLVTVKKPSEKEILTFSEQKGFEDYVIRTPCVLTLPAYPVFSIEEGEKTQCRYHTFFSDMDYASDDNTLLEAYMDKMLKRIAKRWDDGFNPYSAFFYVESKLKWVKEPDINNKREELIELTFQNACGTHSTVDYGSLITITQRNENQLIRFTFANRAFIELNAVT